MGINALRILAGVFTAMTVALLAKDYFSAKKRENQVTPADASLVHTPAPGKQGFLTRAISRLRNGSERRV